MLSPARASPTGSMPSLPADPGFDLDQFISGAKTAYEMIVTAFATGDRELLARLLDKDVYASFASATEARASRGESLMTKVTSIDKTGVFDAPCATEPCRSLCALWRAS